MSKAKLDLLSDEKLNSIVSSSSSYQEVLTKIGYKQTSDKRVIAKLNEKCKQLKISLSHITNDRKCTICQEIKPISDFYFLKDRPMSFCKECQKEKERKRYAEKSQQLIDFKRTLSCKKCGENRFYLLDFHHRNPEEKDYTISDNSRASLETIKKEIDKCDVLCSNCHREWHYLSKTNPQLSYNDWLNVEVGELA